MTNPIMHHHTTCHTPKEMGKIRGQNSTLILWASLQHTTVHTLLPGSIGCHKQVSSHRQPYDAIEKIPDLMTCLRAPGWLRSNIISGRTTLEPALVSSTQCGWDASGCSMTQANCLHTASTGSSAITARPSVSHVGWP